MNKTENRYKIAFLTSESAHNKQSHSGSLYYMSRAIERHCGEITYLEPIISWERRLMGRIERDLLKHSKRKIAYRRLLFIAKKDAKIAEQRLAGQQFDAIIAPDCVPTIAFLQTTTPVLLPLDVTFRLQRNYYPAYSHLLPFSIRQGEIVEQAAFKNASQLLFPSLWAARSAIEDYGIDPQKVHAIPWGANLDHIPPREQLLEKKCSKQCRLLFLGIDWQRKGGDTALEVARRLNETGLETELWVVGCEPRLA